MNRRNTVGLLAAGLLVAGITLFVADHTNAVAAACIRVGLLCAATWLAWRDVQRLSPWMIGPVLMAAAVVAWRPKLFVLVFPVLIAFGSCGRGKRPAGEVRSERRAAGVVGQTRRGEDGGRGTQ